MNDIILLYLMHNLLRIQRDGIICIAPFALLLRRQCPGSEDMPMRLKHGKDLVGHCPRHERKKPEMVFIIFLRRKNQ